VERTGVYSILLQRPEGRNHSEDPGINGIIISKWIRRGGKGGGAWTGFK